MAQTRQSRAGAPLRIRDCGSDAGTSPGERNSCREVSPEEGSKLPTAEST